MAFREYTDKSSLRKKSSRLLQGGETDIVDRNFLGWWERRDLGTDPNDVEFTITAAYSTKPDLIAYDFYGNTNYSWIVLQYNNIVDPNTELTAGSVIRLPSPSYVNIQLLTKPLASRRLTG